MFSSMWVEGGDVGNVLEAKLLLLKTSAVNVLSDCMWFCSLSCALVAFGTTLPGLEGHGNDRVRQRQLAYIQIEGVSGAGVVDVWVCLVYTTSNLSSTQDFARRCSDRTAMVRSGLMPGRVS